MPTIVNELGAAGRELSQEKPEYPHVSNQGAANCAALHSEFTPKLDIAAIVNVIKSMSDAERTAILKALQAGQ